MDPDLLSCWVRGEKPATEPLMSVPVVGEKVDWLCCCPPFAIPFGVDDILVDPRGLEIEDGGNPIPGCAACDVASIIGQN